MYAEDQPQQTSLAQKGCKYMFQMVRSGSVGLHPHVNIRPDRSNILRLVKLG